MNHDGRKERTMKFMLLVLGVAMAAGCAHGSSVRSAASNEWRGAARVAETGRLLLAGPAQTVHASVDGPRAVSLYLVDRVHGDDRDCQSTTYAQLVTQSARLEVGAKQELCAVSAKGSASVLWHAWSGDHANLWALQ
jgi:hypothetical protein